MIWQAFTDVSCVAGTGVVPCLHLSFAAAKHARRCGGAQPLWVQRHSRLRRVSWLSAEGVEAEAALRTHMETIVRFAVIGTDRAVSWAFPELPLVLAGSRLDFSLDCSGLDGRVVFTFDFESPP